MDMTLHHLGYACRDIKEAIKLLKRCHNVIKTTKIIFDPCQNSRVCMVSIENSTCIELIDGEAVKQFLSQNELNFYHICYETKDIFTTAEQLKKKGAIQITNFSPAILFKNRQVVFLKNEFGIIELLETERNTKCISNKEITTLPIHIHATFTANPIYSHIKNILEALNISNLEISDITYSNIRPTVTTNNKPAVLSKKLDLFLIRIIDWYQFDKIDTDLFRSATDEGCKNLLLETREGAKLTLYPRIFLLCPCIEFIGNKSLEKYIQNLERKLVKELNRIPFTVCYTSETQMTAFAWQKNRSYTNVYALKNAHIPYNQIFFGLISLSIVKEVLKVISLPYKVIVLDCDGTLWQGISAEVCDKKELLISTEHKNFQIFIKSLTKAGYILCLCSKNNEVDVFDVIAQHPDMCLKLEDITAWKINWESKTNNIIALAKELKLSLDSFIFIDNNPIECREVKSALPQILVAQIPEDSENLSAFLNSLWINHYKKKQHDQNPARFLQTRCSAEKNGKYHPDTCVFY